MSTNSEVGEETFLYFTIIIISSLLSTRSLSLGTTKNYILNLIQLNVH